MTEPQAFQDIAENLSFLDDWEDRYHYLIELGEAMQPLEEHEKTETNKVRECASKAWLVTEIEKRNDTYILNYRGESDSAITHGLIAIALALYSGKPPSEILETDALAAIASIGLQEHVTPQRANGLVAMVNRIRKEAKALS